jgi:hypothetical protein
VLLLVLPSPITGNLSSEDCHCEFTESNMECAVPYPVNYPIPACCQKALFSLNVNYSIIHLDFSTSPVRFASYDLGANCSSIKVRVFTPHHPTYPTHYFTTRYMNCSNFTVSLDVYDFPYVGMDFVYDPLCGGIPTTPCKGSNPGPDFICKDGVWLGVSVNSTGDVQLSGPSYVIGNITAETLEFDGYINVTGCLDIQKIRYKPSEINDNLTLILSHGQDCPYVPEVEVSISDIPCKKIQSRITGSYSLYVEMFLIDDPACQYKRKTNIALIIGLSIGGAALVVGVLVALTVFYKPFRNVVRPFSKRSNSNR